MSIYARVMGLEEPKIAGHVLIAIIAEYAKGNITGNQAKTYLELSTAEATQAQELMNRVKDGFLTSHECEWLFALGEYIKTNNPYDTEAKLKTRLGVTN